MKTYYYFVDRYNRDDADVDRAFTFTSVHDSYDIENWWDAESIVADMASDYFHNHDGWEGWDNGNEVIISVWDSNKKFIGRFDVYLEYEPTFGASRRD